MCGIFGVFAPGGTVNLDDELLVRCTRLMRHRGPDDEGYHRGPDVFLGHQRLSIIDIEGGKQPIYNEDGTKCIIFNGEIYNYRALRGDLIEAGHVFSTKSDTEVILHAYEEYGPMCLARFRGIFALAIHDAAAGVLYLGRDHLGVKPLYYIEEEGRILFASEIRSLLGCASSSPRVDLGMVDFFLSLGYTPNPHTFFQGIRKIPPGCFAVSGPGRPIQVEKYWSLETIPSATALPSEESVSTLRRKLAESVELQMVSEVPIGVFLSGGLDSSAVVALMRRITDGEIKTFSVGYSDFGSVSELPYARRVAEMFRTRHFEYDLKFGEFFESIRTMLAFAEEPIVESAAIALYHLSVQAKKEATVLLSGEGSDELFAGYPLHRRMRTLQFLARAAARFPGFLRNLPDHLPLTEKQRKYADWIRVPLERRYRTVSCDVTDSIRKKMYTREYLDASGRSLDAFFERSTAERNGMSDLTFMLYLDTKYWLPDDLLLKADKMTMAASLELRVPFLDPEIVEFAAGLPDDYKIREGEGKHILKKAMKGLLPDNIIYRTKQGFPLPLRQWLQGSLYGPTRDILLSSRFLDRGIVRRDYVEGVLGSHRAGKEDHSRRIFSFLALEIWMRTFQENPVVSG